MRSVNARIQDGDRSQRCWGDRAVNLVPTDLREVPRKTGRGCLRRRCRRQCGETFDLAFTVRLNPGNRRIRREFLCDRGSGRCRYFHNVQVQFRDGSLHHSAMTINCGQLLRELQSFRRLDDDGRRRWFRACRGWRTLDGGGRTPRNPKTVKKNQNRKTGKTRQHARTLQRSLPGKRL